MSFSHELLPFFECKKLDFFPFSGIHVFEAATLACKQKVILIQFLIYKIKASFVPNSKPLPRLAHFLHVSDVLFIQKNDNSVKYLAI